MLRLLIMEKINIVFQKLPTIPMFDTDLNIDTLYDI